MKIKDHFYFRPLIFLAALALLLSPFAFCPAKAIALSTEDEKEMGREFVFQVKRYYEVLDDDFANQYFSGLARYLLNQLETQPFQFHFYLIKDKTLNAFAGPGGHIFFFSGLINTMGNADELASILCHEIGHVSARHLAHRMEQNKKIGFATMAGILAGILVGGEAAGALMMGSMAAGTQAQLHYSRNDERQADQLGYKYMEESGFDPKGLISTLKKIEKNSWVRSDQIPTYLLTHPAGPERMSNLDAMIRGFSPKVPKEKANRFKDLFPMFQTVIKAKSLDPKDGEKLFAGELEKDPDSVSSHFGLGLVYIGMMEYTQAIRHLERALEEKSDFVPILTNLGTAYQLNGENDKAISLFVRAMRLSSEDRSIPYLLGVSYEKEERYEEAVSLFERLTFFRPVKDSVYEHLGMSYAGLQKMVHAHYNFGIYNKRIGQMDTATFHFQKALKLAANDPKMKEKILKETKGLPQQSHRR